MWNENKWKGTRHIGIYKLLGFKGLADVECASRDCVKILGWWVHKKGLCEDFWMMGSQEGHWSASLLLTKFCQKPNLLKLWKWWSGFWKFPWPDIKKLKENSPNFCSRVQAGSQNLEKDVCRDTWWGPYESGIAFMKTKS
jgi:hypothetical protein